MFGPMRIRADPLPGAPEVLGKDMNRTSFARLAPVALFFAMAAAGTAQAATDGSLGATSTGTVTINASVAARVQISKLSDVTFSAVDAGTAQSNSQNICVWSN